MTQEEKTVQQWEYETLPAKQFVGIQSQLGEQGWEVSGVIVEGMIEPVRESFGGVSGGSGHIISMVILKRPKP